MPAVRDPRLLAFLRQLLVDWPAADAAAAAAAAEASQDLRSRALAQLIPAPDPLPPGVLGRVSLKGPLEGRGRTAGYDPSLSDCLGKPWEPGGARETGGPSPSPACSRVLSAVTEELLSVLAELQEAVRRGPEHSSPGPVSVPPSILKASAKQESRLPSPR